MHDNALTVTDDRYELIDSHVDGHPPDEDTGIVRSSLAIADKTRGDRVGAGPEDYERGPASAGAATSYRFGPELIDGGVRFRLFASSVEAVDLILDDRSPVAMRPTGEGWFAAEIAGAGPGTRYRFSAAGAEFADPASRSQEDDAAGWSIVRGPLPPAAERSTRPWHEAVIAEIHVGTASPEGTFAGLAKRLPAFAEAGYTVIELMPLGDFPGANNWGYDGVLLFAPERSYGTPEDLRALVDAAHALGLAVMVDVVYNHFGPVDNFLPLYAQRFFDESVRTPWGAGLNFADPTVRLFFLENVRMWLEDYDVDGLRFDAVHEFGTSGGELMKEQLAAMARAIKPNALLVLENAAKDVRWLQREASGRPRHFDAQWNDDIHHVLHVIATEQNVGYYRAFTEGTVDKARRALSEGFAFQHRPTAETGASESPAQLPPSAFVSFIQNHDQIGNQPDGRRIAGELDPDRLDFLHFVVMLSPQIPMFFMGEEAHIKVPFPFFGDLRGHFRDEIREGRARQAIDFFETADADELVHDPALAETAALAKLPWDQYETPEHRGALDRFRALARLRREHLWPLTATPYRGSSATSEGSVVVVTWRYAGGTLSMILNASYKAGSIEWGAFEPILARGTLHAENGRIGLGPWTAAIAITPPDA